MAADYRTQHNALRYCANATNIEHSNGIIAIGIAGISRGIQYTLPSVERHVLDVLRNNNFEFDVFWSALSHPAWDGHQLDDFEVAKMHPCLFSVHSQEYFKEKAFEKFCKERTYDCKSGGISSPLLSASEAEIYGYKHSKHMIRLKSYLSSFHAQKWLAEMISAHSVLRKFEYDAVLVIRPDLMLIRDIDLAVQLPNIKANRNRIWIPDFDMDNGLNDRAAFGSQRAMLKYLERGDAFMSNISYGIVVSDQYLSDFVAQSNLIVQSSSMRFVRVRPLNVNGTTEGIVDDHDSNATVLNIAADDSDLLRCTGEEYYVHDTLNVRYKLVNVDQC